MAAWTIVGMTEDGMPDYTPRPLATLEYLEAAISTFDGVGRELALDMLAEIRRLRARIVALDAQLASAAPTASSVDDFTPWASDEERRADATT